jgi:hypothetical protein
VLSAEYRALCSRSHAERGNTRWRLSASPLSQSRAGTQSVRTYVPTLLRGNEDKRRNVVLETALAGNY